MRAYGVRRYRRLCNSKGSLDSGIWREILIEIRLHSRLKLVKSTRWSVNWLQAYPSLRRHFPNILPSRYQRKFKIYAGIIAANSVSTLIEAIYALVEEV